MAMIIGEKKNEETYYYLWILDTLVDTRHTIQFIHYTTNTIYIIHTTPNHIRMATSYSN